MRILMITTTSPGPLKPRLASFASCLQGAGHIVDIVAVTDHSWGAPKSEENADLRPFSGSALTAVPYKLTFRQMAYATARTITLKSSSESALYQDARARDEIGQLARDLKPDVVHVDRTRSVFLATNIRLPKVVDLTDPRGVWYPGQRLFIQRTSRGIAEELRRLFDYVPARREEVRSLKDIPVLTASPQGSKLLHQAGREQDLTAFVPNAVPRLETTICEARTWSPLHIAMTGNLSYPPNEFAVKRFARMLARLQAEGLRARGFVIGARPRPWMREFLAKMSIELKSGGASISGALIENAINLCVSSHVSSFGFPNRVTDALRAQVPIAVSRATLASMPAGVAGAYEGLGDFEHQVRKFVGDPELAALIAARAATKFNEVCAPHVVARKLTNTYERAISIYCD